MRVRLGEFGFDQERRQVLRRVEPVALEPRPFGLLSHLPFFETGRCNEQALALLRGQEKA